MFVPKHFRITEEKEIITFIRAHSFATLVTFDGVKPIATHIPIFLREIDGDYIITGHIAYGNKQWKTFTQDNQVLIIFQGPHAYVSASWYGHENVSTWNYQAVHVYGKIHITTAEERKEDVILLQHHYEQHQERKVTWETLAESTRNQVKGIVGFRIEIEGIEASYKMSQNRNEADYDRVIEHLKNVDDLLAHNVAETMETLKGRDE